MAKHQTIQIKYIYFCVGEKDIERDRLEIQTNRQVERQIGIHLRGMIGDIVREDR